MIFSLHSNDIKFALSAVAAAAATSFAKGEHHRISNTT